MYKNLIIKGAIGALTLGLTSVCVISWVDKEMLGIYDDVYLFMMSETTTNNSRHENAPSNFECKMENEASDKKFYCEIHKLAKDNSGKHLIKTFSKNQEKQYQINDLKTENNVFMMKFKGWKGLVAKTIKKINVLDAKNNVEATLQPVFGAYKHDFVQDPEYVIVQANIRGETKTQNHSSDSAKCWGWKCEVYNFADTTKITEQKNVTDFHNIPIKKPNTPLTETTTIEHQKFYFVKFTDPTKLNTMTFEEPYMYNDKPVEGFTLRIISLGLFYDKNDHLFAY